MEILRPLQRTPPPITSTLSQAPGLEQPALEFLGLIIPGPSSHPRMSGPGPGCGAGSASAGPWEAATLKLFLQK